MLTNTSHLCSSTIIKKAIVALTGLVMIGFLVVHLLGNLQVFAGAGVTPETTKLNEYALLLKKEPVLLWGARLFLILTAILHVMTTITLTQHNRDARPQHYEVRHSYASYASQMMIFGGLAILFTLFTIYFTSQPVLFTLIILLRMMYIRI